MHRIDGGIAKIKIVTFTYVYVIQTMDEMFKVLLDSPGLVTLQELLPLPVVRIDVDPPVAKPFASDMVTMNSAATGRPRGKEKVPCWPL